MFFVSEAQSGCCNQSNYKKELIKIAKPAREGNQNFKGKYFFDFLHLSNNSSKQHCREKKRTEVNSFFSLLRNIVLVRFHQGIIVLKTISRANLKILFK